MFGVFMTINTPSHIKGLVAIGERHLADGAVTGRAAHPFIHMNAVIEINEIRLGVDARPLQRYVRCVTGAHRFQHGGYSATAWNGNSCRYGWWACPRRKTSPPWYGSTGNQCRHQSHDAYG